MTIASRAYWKVAAALLCALAVCLVPQDAAGQSDQASASSLIQFLTYQSDERRGKPALSSCGAVNADRAAATSLASLAAASRQEVGAALESIEQLGEQSEFSFNGGWLLLVYAKEEGVMALPRLRRMVGDPILKGTFLDSALDNSLAISLGLTSYVSSSRSPTDVVCRSEQPRDTLDRFLLAWERDDSSTLRATLGPRALDGLNLLLLGRAWADMRSDLWGPMVRANVSIGYRFEIPGQWSEPEETLDRGARRGIDVSNVPRGLEIPTRFDSAGGKECGRASIKFLRANDAGGPSTDQFLIDNADIGELLHLATACATSQ